MLSNTETPKYYGEFRESVITGDTPVCQEISMEMNRIDSLIENPRYYYDRNAIDGFIQYCENELTLTDGSSFKMLPVFKLWAESLLSWFYFEELSVYVPFDDRPGGRYVTKRIKRRLINKQYLIVGRGAAKSMYASFIHAYFLNIDTSTTHQVATAPTMAQADETLSPLRTAVARSHGPLFEFMTNGSIRNTNGSQANKQFLASTKKGIENFVSGSLVEIRPMRIDKLQGLRTKVNTVDEWLSGDVREDVVGALEQGASKIDDWIIVATSSEGTVRNSVGDSIKMELAKILKGEYQDPHTSIWHYRLDDVKEVGDPNMWVKAQPNLGRTVSYETYQRDVNRAENIPEVRNDILAKRFGIPMEGYTYFFTYQETLPKRKREFWSMPCSLGLDLSQGDDFCAFTFLFPLTADSFGVKTRCYISSRTQLKLPGALREKYDHFIREGSLRVLDGTILDMMEVYDDISRFIEENEYDIRSVGFDPYNAKDFMERWSREHGDYGIRKVIQGARTESVPLGELKALAQDGHLHFDQELMSYSMGNAITIQDTNGNRKLYKKRSDQKIDSVAAMMDALVAYKDFRDEYE